MMLAAKIEVPATVWLAVAGFVLVIGPLALVAVRRAWRDDPRWRTAPSAWGGTERGWQAFVRGTVPCLLSLSGAVSLVFVFAFFEEGSTAFIVLDLVCLAVAFGGMLLTLTAVLLARPRFLLPPPRRRDESPVGRMLRRLRRGGPSGRGPRADAREAGPPAKP